MNVLITFVPVAGLTMETFLGDINVSGLCSIILFYLLILGVGMWAARKKSDVEGVSEEVELDISTVLLQFFKILK